MKELAEENQVPMRRHTAVGMSVALWLIASLAVFLFSADSNKQGLEQAERLVTSSAEQSAFRVEDFVSARIFALQALAGAYSSGEQVTEAGFRRSAEALHQRFDGLLAVNWVEPDSTISLTIPVEQNQAARGRKLENHEGGATPFYVEARKTGEPRMTRPLELFQGGTGVATYFPVERDGVHIGTVNGVFRVDSLLQESLRGGVLDNYAVKLVDGDRAFYVDEEFEVLSLEHSVAAHDLRLLGQTWTLEITPRTALWQTIRPDRSNTLMVGLLCALLLGLMAFFALQRQRQKFEALQAIRQAERRAQQAEKFDALGRLARGITHDFNNLLTAVGTSAELIELDEPLTEAGRANIDAIREASDRARELTRQLMLFGNPNAAVATPSETRLVEFSKKWEKFLTKLVGRGVSFEFHEAPDAVVAMEESTLMRVLTNLVVNASDAIEGKGTIEVSWDVDAENLQMRVRDDGSGMPKDVQERIFEPYFTTKGEDGTGLGLPTVYGIVQAAGGSLDVQSTVGVGTTIVVSLPVIDQG